MSVRTETKDFTLASHFKTVTTGKNKLGFKELRALAEIVRIEYYSFATFDDITDPTIICCFTGGESSAR